MRVAPDLVLSDVFDLDAAQLRAMGIRHLAFDVDQTIAIAQAAAVDARRLQKLRSLAAELDSVSLATNSRRDLVAMAASIGANLYQPTGLLCRKPRRMYFRRFVRLLAKQHPGVTPDQILMVGDQLKRDVLAAKRVGLRGALIAPLGQEQLWHRLVMTRRRERRHLLRLGIVVPPKRQLLSA